MSFDWFIDNIIWIALWYFIVFHMAGSLFSQKMLHSNLSKISEIENKVSEWENRPHRRILRPEMNNVKIDRSKWENGPDRKKIL